MEQKSRILLIDDEEVVRDSCTQILSGGPYEIAAASDGEAGLSLIVEFKPDLVFVDLKMPGISGFEVLEKMQQIDPTIVMVVITGFASISSAVDAMKRGAYDFLPKPFTPEEFRLITRRSLEKRKLTLETISLRREKELLREQFAHIVSHELKAPLSAVQQNMYALEFELSNVLSDGQKEKLERIKVRIEDLLTLINTWLKIISTDIGTLKQSFKTISVMIPISKALDSVETLAARKNIEIVKNIGESLPLISGDDVSLSEAFVNVIGNAIKYSRDGSKVHLNVEEINGNIKISIKDTGVGIPPEELPHVFEGFYRGATGQAAATGQGIGLAVSKHIIDAHDGTIAVQSEPGVGTTFLIELPGQKK